VTGQGKTASRWDDDRVALSAACSFADGSMWFGSTVGPAELGAGRFFLPSRLLDRRVGRPSVDSWVQCRCCGALRLLKKCDSCGGVLSRLQSFCIVLALDWFSATRPRINVVNALRGFGGRRIGLLAARQFGAAVKPHSPDRPWSHGFSAR